MANLVTNDPLEVPDEIMPGGEHEEIAVKQFGTREIRVVFEEIGRETVVIYTVMQRRIRA